MGESANLQEADTTVRMREDSSIVRTRTTVPGLAVIESTMNLSADILARDGGTTRVLTLQRPKGGRGAPVLVDTTGEVFGPWELELLHWPPEAEAELRRGGYIGGRPPDLEPWCNCAD